MILVLLQNDQNVCGVLSFGLNRLQCEDEHSPPSVAEVKNEWSYTCAPPMPSWRVQGRLYVFYSVTRNVTSVYVIVLSQYCSSLLSPHNNSWPLCNRQLN